jgi:L-lysine 2,3-aminomutase
MLNNDVFFCHSILEVLDPEMISREKRFFRNSKKYALVIRVTSANHIKDQVIEASSRLMNVEVELTCQRNKIKGITNDRKLRSNV